MERQLPSQHLELAELREQRASLLADDKACQKATPQHWTFLAGLHRGIESGAMGCASFLERPHVTFYRPVLS